MKDATIFFGLMAPNSIESCGMWTLVGSRILANDQDSYNEITTVEIVKRALSSEVVPLYACKFRKYFLSTEGSNVVWVYNLGTSAQFSGFQNTYIMKLFVFFLISPIWFYFATFVLFCIQKSKSIRIEYLLVLAGSFGVLLLSEWNSRYFLLFTWPLTLYMLLRLNGHEESRQKGMGIDTAPNPREAF
jgi:hypothetical protein